MENGSKNKIKLMIADNVFTLVSSEDEGYSRHLAAKIDESIREISRGASVSVTAAAILTALNYCDKFEKAQTELDELKKQLSGYLAEISECQTACEALTKENRRLREDIAIYRNRLASDG